MKKYPFTASGVKQWLQLLYSAPIDLQMLEQEIILMSLSSWLSTRFELQEEQIEYIQALDSGFKGNLAQELTFAINNQSVITLDKQPHTAIGGTLARDSVKVTEYETRKVQSSAAPVSDADLSEQLATRTLDAYLTIRIFYQLK